MALEKLQKGIEIMIDELFLGRYTFFYYFI